jgi:tetratricopeptide (TPR) repeat protein
VFTKLNELDRAESDALRAFEADTQLEGAVDLIYAIYRAQGRLDEARESFEEADKAGVLHAGARLLLGRIYLQQGDRQKAVETFERILRQNPELSAAKNDLAYLLADENRDLDRALNLAEEAQQSMSTDPNAADTVGYVYYRRGLHEAALQQFHYALELNRDRRNHLEPTLHYHLGLALDALERGDEATASFRRALQLDSNFPDAEDARRRIEAKGQTSPAAPRPS